MRIRFSTQFGSDVWDGTQSQALFNADTCSATQLLGHLETALGQASQFSPSSVRAASLLGSLWDDESTFYHQSALNDPLGVARRLLRDFDTLRLYGWQPHETDTPRLRQLAHVCAAAPPGPADRLARVVAAMPTRKARIESIELYELEESLPELWQQLFDKLRAAGTRITNVAAPSVAGQGDVAWAATRQGTPVGDGSLQLLTTQGPLEAADHVAAWLAADKLTEMVIVGADSILDSAMARHGLPALGCRSPALAPAVQLVSLVVDMAYGPTDPGLASEFLTISPNPISWPLRRRLLGALARWPAVDSTSWREVLALHAAEQPDVAEADKRALDAYFSAPLNRTSDVYPVALLETRLGSLQQFFEAQSPPPLDAVSSCSRLREAAVASGLQDFTHGQLQRLLAAILAELPGASATDAEAGVFCISNAASIVAPARRIVWWNFTVESVQTPRGLSLMHPDAECLRARGVTLPSSAAIAANNARAWRGPLWHTRETLLLVAPGTSATGEVAHPHPLWDEIAAAVSVEGRPAAMQALVVRHPTQRGRTVPMAPRKLQPLPLAMTHPVKVTSRALKRDGPESPHSIETMLGCSVKWALHYLASLQAPCLTTTAVTPLETGSFAHHLLETLAMQPFGTVQEAADAARILFDSEAPRHLAPLYLPGNAAQLHAMRAAFTEAVGKLTEIRLRQGWRVAASEIALSKPFHAIELRGILDARLEDPIGVVDFKWSGGTKYRTFLEQGTALQLGIYSYLCADDESRLTPIAYYILDRHKLLTPEVGAISGASPLRGASVATIWHAAKAAMMQALERLADGQLSAPANMQGYDARAVNEVVKGVLNVAPACTYCEFSVLCGAAWKEAR